MRLRRPTLVKAVLLLALIVVAPLSVISCSDSSDEREAALTQDEPGTTGTAGEADELCYSPAPPSSAGGEDPERLAVAAEQQANYREALADELAGADGTDASANVPQGLIDAQAEAADMLRDQAEAYRSGDEEGGDRLGIESYDALSSAAAEAAEAGFGACSQPVSTPYAPPADPLPDAERDAALAACEAGSPSALRQVEVPAEQEAVYGQFVDLYERRAAGSAADSAAALDAEATAAARLGLSECVPSGGEAP
jgi:hypothetical protein